MEQTSSIQSKGDTMTFAVRSKPGHWLPVSELSLKQLERLYRKERYTFLWWAVKEELMRRRG